MIMQIILGSHSPRRKEILGYFNLPFKVAVSSFPEETIPFEGNAKEYASKLSESKANVLYPIYPEAVIITADTVVFREGKIYDKPKNHTEAFKALSELVGQWHSVYTSVTVRKEMKVYTDVEETRVLFNPLTPEQIKVYQSKIHCWDKAGGYAIQGAGSLIVQKIDGCYYNVMGLPINTLQKLLLKVEIDLWRHL
jgi:septum formation protein